MDSVDRPSFSSTLGASVRLIRKHRRLKTIDVARAMGMSLRSYEYFEAGGGKVNLERIHRFAEVAGADPYAILASMALGSPAFALRCADNKLMTILMVALQELDDQVGDAVADLDALLIINSFTKAMKELAALSAGRDGGADEWLQQRLGRLIPPSDGSDVPD